MTSDRYSREQLREMARTFLYAASIGDMRCISVKAVLLVRFGYPWSRLYNMIIEMAR
jgi:hypothetical protein